MISAGQVSPLELEFLHFSRLVEELNKRDERVMIEIKHVHSDDCQERGFLSPFLVMKNGY